MGEWIDMTTDELAEECLQARRVVRLKHRECKRRLWQRADAWAHATEYVVRGVTEEELTPLWR